MFMNKTAFFFWHFMMNIFINENDDLYVNRDEQITNMM